MARHRTRLGQKKYRCGECSADSFHHWIERNRAARLRCPACGSARMELVTKEAKDEAANAQSVRVDGGTVSTTLPQEKPNRRVT